MSEMKHIVSAVVVVIALAAVTAYAWATGRWLFTAIPIGVLFGFFLQKGDLCGSSAFSEVILAHDWRKVWGLWVAIVVSMLGIAIGDLMGWIVLNPKPFMWAGAIIGGLIFGVGMVLAGGCVSGCLFKGAAGNLNSIVAVIAMPFGIALVEYGPLEPWSTQLKAMRIPAEDGGPVTLSSLTGAPFWLLALLIGLATVVTAILLTRHTSAATPESQPRPRAAAPTLSLSGSWKPWQAGLAIGLLALPAYLSSAASGRNYPLGVTHGVLHASLLVTDAPVRHVVTAPSSAPAPAIREQPAPRKKVVWWLVLLVGGLVVGSHISGRASGQTKLLPKPPDQVVIAIGGGFLVGVGATLATGCVIGNILSGWALMSVGTVLFGATTIVANWATTVVYLRGIR
jgi:uncharacterized membrane protein YedE/YeeE